MSVVAQTDGICFSLSTPIVSRMRMANYESNIYGWGISWMMVAGAFSRNLFVVVDESVFVEHPVGSGYSHREALAQQAEFLEQLTPQEQIQYRLLNSHFRLQQLKRMPALKIARNLMVGWSKLTGKLRSWLR